MNFYTNVFDLYKDISNRKTGEIHLADLMWEKQLLNNSHIMESKLYPEFRRQAIKNIFPLHKMVI
jgi:hypothetical protein